MNGQAQAAAARNPRAAAFFCVRRMAVCSSLGKRQKSLKHSSGKNDQNHMILALILIPVTALSCQMTNYMSLILHMI